MSRLRFYLTVLAGGILGVSFWYSAKQNHALCLQRQNLSAELARLAQGVQDATAREERDFSELKKAEASASQAALVLSHQRQQDVSEKIEELRRTLTERGPKPPAPDGPEGNIVFKDLAGDPDYARYVHDFERGGAAREFGHFLKLFNDSPAIQSRVFDLLTDWHLVPFDTAAAAVGAGLDPVKNRAEINRTIGKVTEAIMGDIQSLVGFDARQQLSLLRNSTTNARITPIVQRLSYSAEPLTSAQLDRLKEMTLASARSRPAGRPPSVLEVATAAQSIFTPAQWKEVREYARENGAALTP